MKLFVFPAIADVVFNLSHQMAVACKCMKLNMSGAENRSDRRQVVIHFCTVDQMGLGTMCVSAAADICNMCNIGVRKRVTPWHVKSAVQQQSYDELNWQMQHSRVFKFLHTMHGNQVNFCTNLRLPSMKSQRELVDVHLVHVQMFVRHLNNLVSEQ